MIKINHSYLTNSINLCRISLYKNLLFYRYSYSTLWLWLVNNIYFYYYRSNNKPYKLEYINANVKIAIYKDDLLNPLWAE